MPVQNKPIIHARDHEEGGADPIRFPTSIPGDFESMARAWSDAYWKLEETTTGSWFYDELPGHHDLEATTESGLTRGVGHGPAEPDSVGITLDSPAMSPGTGIEGPHLRMLGDDQELGVIADDSMGFFAVISPDGPGVSSPLHQFYAIAGVYDPADFGTDFNGVRWALCMVPVQVETDPVSYGYNLAGWAWGGGTEGPDAAPHVIGSALLAHPLGFSLPGEEIDVALTYNSAVLKIYVNGLLDGQESVGSMWDGIPTRTGTFVMGAMDFEHGITHGWRNYNGGIGMAMLSVDGELTSGQIKNLHEGEPVVGSFPGEITEEQHGTIPSGDLHPEYLREAEVAAKGDLLAGTGTGAVDNLPVGTNGQVLTADSTAATGMKWAAGGDPALDTLVWLPLTTVTGGVPELVWDADDSLIPTLDPI